MTDYEEKKKHSTGGWEKKKRILLSLFSYCPIISVETHTHKAIHSPKDRNIVQYRLVVAHNFRPLFSPLLAFTALSVLLFLTVKKQWRRTQVWGKNKDVCPEA